MLKKLLLIAMAAGLFSIMLPAGVYASHGHVFREPDEDVLKPCETKAIDCGDMSIYKEDPGYDVGYEKDAAESGESDDAVIYETTDESEETQ
jgi:hypothetical protein